MKKLTPSQQIFWERLAGHQVTRTGQPRRRHRSRESSIQQGLWTDHDEWVYNQPSRRLRELLERVHDLAGDSDPSITDRVPDPAAADIMAEIRARTGKKSHKG